MIRDQDVERPARSHGFRHDAARGIGVEEVGVDEDDAGIDGAQRVDDGSHRAIARHAEVLAVVRRKALDRHASAQRRKVMRDRETDALAPAHSGDQRVPAAQRLGALARVTMIEPQG